MEKVDTWVSFSIENKQFSGLSTSPPPPNPTIGREWNVVSLPPLTPWLGHRPGVMIEFPGWEVGQPE